MHLTLAKASNQPVMANQQDKTSNTFMNFKTLNPQPRWIP